MPDTVFRSKAEESAPEKLPEAPEATTVSDDKVDVPYTDAQNFIEDYFGLGTEWKDYDATFDGDIRKIDSYVKHKIAQGEIANDQKTVRELIKSMEKVNNLTKESRSVVKLEVLANYVDFLMKNDDLKSHLRRYGST